MRKLILLLLAFLAVFTYIRAYDRDSSPEIMAADAVIEMPLEIRR